VVTNDQECLYQSPGFFPEHSPEEWSRILGPAVQRCSTAEWETAANELDTDRSIRDAADQATQQEFSDLDAFFKEMGHYPGNDRLSPAAFRVVAGVMARAHPALHTTQHSG